MNSTAAAPRRHYSMDKRAGAAEQTTSAILDSALELYWQLPIEQITLALIAEKADVTVQTVIRKFGGRDQVLTAAADRARPAIEDQRNEAPVGDREQIVKVLVEHYELHGDGVMKLLAEESRLPAIAQIVASGRKLHREWCARVFAPQLKGLGRADRQIRLAQLIAICDVYTWKLLRCDSRLSRKNTESAIVELLGGLELAAK